MARLMEDWDDHAAQAPAPLPYTAEELEGMFKAARLDKPDPWAAWDHVRWTTVDDRKPAA
jgi:hypothetical protein